MENSLYAGRKNKDIEECSISTLVRKCFACFTRKQTFDDADEEFLLEQDDFSFTPGVLVKKDLKNIPIEILWEICYKLPPLDVIQLSRTSKNLRIKINEEFWKSYIKLHGQKRWDKFTPPIKVAYAFSLFAEKKIKQAAKLGLPEAIKSIGKKENEKEEKKWRSSPYLSVNYQVSSYERNGYTNPFHLKMRDGFHY